ncbi:MAG: hypothetical protein BGO43_15045 [Gammaproteobacteria bacterium 39-13]|nr:hypothetical protein [Gammaproteobacteria bacterium]OJV86255.1 MAG: hypothetical protein BGO43_15045 [Gammaproteobacteria bacterium 39-13]
MSIGGPVNFEEAIARFSLLLGTAEVVTGNNLLVIEEQKTQPKPLYEQSLKQKALAQNDKNRSSGKPQHFGKRDTPIGRLRNR